MNPVPINLKTGITPVNSSKGLGDKAIPNHSPDPWRFCIVLRHVFLIQSFTNQFQVPSPLLGRTNTLEQDVQFRNDRIGLDG